MGLALRAGGLGGRPARSASCRRIRCSSARSSADGSRPISSSALTGIAVGGERLRLSAGAVEGEHLLGAQPLAMRVCGDERVQLAGDGVVRARVELRRDPGLDRREPRFVETRRVGAHERLVGDVGERRAAPERERLREAAVGDELLEAGGVQLAGLDPQQVAGGARDDPVGSERLAEGVDVHLERAADARGRILAPHGVDQPVGRDRFVAVEQQEREQRSWALPPERQGLPAVPEHLQRPEHPELHDPEPSLKPDLSRS